MTITRVGHCTKCYVANRPATGQQFLVFGSTTRKFKGCVAKHNGRRGFTPHIYRIIDVVNNRVFYKVICAMEGCGAKLIDETNFIRLDEKEWVCKSMTIADWNGLLKYKDSEYKI